ncbi:MAG TPA: BrnT family toxin [Thermoanaerobaculia bacterium]|nr:BrnT family toxin [Thermoanaerobaculia bacterium]
MRYAWDEAKRVANLRKHGLDFADAPEVFAGPTCTVEDDRLAYREKRFLSVGVLRGLPVSIVHTETDHEIRIISFRKATKREIAFLIENL